MPPVARALSAALVLSAQTLFGQIASADVTPEQVWQGWQDFAKAQGQTVTAKDTRREGDTLIVTGVIMSMTSDSSKASVALGKLQFQDKGDGTVAILLPESYPLHMTLPPPKGVPDGRAADVTATVLMPGAEIVASGVPLSISLQASLPRMEVAAEVTSADPKVKSSTSIIGTLTGITAHYLIEGAEAGQNITQDFAAKTLSLNAKIPAQQPGDAADITFSLSDVGGKFELSSVPTSGMADFNAALQAGLGIDISAHYGDGMLHVTGPNGTQPSLDSTLGSGSFAMAMNASTLHMDLGNKALSVKLNGPNTKGGTNFALTGSLADFTTKVDASGGNWANLDDFAAALKAGLGMTGSLGIGAMSFDFADDSSKPTKVKAALASASTDFAMDAKKITYNLAGKGFSATVSAPDIPVPQVSADLGELAFGFKMPIAKSATPAPFIYLTRIVDLNLPESLWALADPTAALPHGPASLIIDTKGLSTITRDMVQDVAAVQTGSGEPPGLLNALDLSQINLKALGAEVTAAGSFTFDNSDLTTFKGMPLPTGKIDIKATGVNTLVDKLVTMGLLQKEQAMQGRMGIAMFGDTSSTADEITSKLEFKDKHFFANGVQMQ